MDKLEIFFHLRLQNGSKRIYGINDSEVIAYKNSLKASLVAANVNPELKFLYDKVKKDYDDYLIKKRKESYEIRIKDFDNKNECMCSIHNATLGKSKSNNFLGFTINRDDTANQYNYFFIKSVPNH